MRNRIDICEPVATSDPLVCGVKLSKGVPGSLAACPASYRFDRGGKMVVTAAASRVPKLGKCGGRILIELRNNADAMGITEISFSPRNVIVRVACSRHRVNVTDLLTELVDKNLSV